MGKVCTVIEPNKVVILKEIIRGEIDRLRRVKHTSVQLNYLGIPVKVYAVDSPEEAFGRWWTAYFSGRYEIRQYSMVPLYGISKTEDED